MSRLSLLSLLLGAAQLGGRPCAAHPQARLCRVLAAVDAAAASSPPDGSAVEVVCREGPRYVLELARMGAEFTRSQGGGLHLTREGGHSARRIVHAADATGAEIERALLARARAHPNIAFFEHTLGLDLLVEALGDQVRGLGSCWWLRGLLLQGCLHHACPVVLCSEQCPTPPPPTPPPPPPGHTLLPGC